MLPETSVDVAAFVADLEKRLAEDEEEYKCCVCYEPFANAPLECCHRLCPECFEKLDTCPLCRVSFEDKKLDRYFTEVKYDRLDVPLPPANFAYVNLMLTMRKSLFYAGRYEVSFVDLSDGFAFARWSDLGNINLKVTKTHKILMLIDDPLALLSYCSWVNDPLRRIPFNSVDSLFDV